MPTTLLPQHRRANHDRATEFASGTRDDVDARGAIVSDRSGMPDPERARSYAWCPLVARSDVMCLERTMPDTGSHLHEGFQLSLVDSATVSSDAHGRPYPALPPSLLAVNPFTLHSDGPLADGDWSVRELHVGANVLADVRMCMNDRATDGPPTSRRASADRAAPWFATRVIYDDALSAELSALFDGLRTGNAGTDRCASTKGAGVAALALEYESRLLRLLATLVARHSARPPAICPVLRAQHGVGLAREYLHAHVKDPVSLADLAAVAGVNKFHLIRAFEREIGVPPHAYHIHLRLARARHLIERGAPLSHVAFDAGFADQSHLTRQFKALLGVTPGQYARCHERTRDRAVC